MPQDSPSVSVSRGHGRLGSDSRRSVVWVRGEHDIATQMHLSDTIVQVARLDDADIVVDLSGVTFLDASTINALVAAGNRLRACSLSLSVRAPSPLARRLLDVCGLEQLIDDRPVSAREPVATALGTWVDVSAGDRSADSAQTPIHEETPSQEPARRRGEPEGSVQQRRALS